MIRLIKKLSNFRREKAQTMVEFALVFPIVLLITYGIIEFGRMIFIYASVTAAARDGARYGAASGSLTDPYFKDCTGIRTATKRGAILFSIPTNNITIWYDKGPGTPHISDSCPPGVGSIKLGYRIGVHVSAQYQPIIRFLGLSGFEIVSENARTILVDMQMVTPSP